MPKLRIYLSVVLAFLSLAAAIPAMAAGELKIVYNAGVAPVVFEDADSRPMGLLPDLWRLWAQKAGREIEFVRVDSFEESLQLLEDGKVDLHAGLFKTPEREEYLAYSQPLLALDYYIFTHPSVYPIKSLEKTAGFIVGVQKGGYTEQFVRAKVPGDRIAVYDQFQDLFRAALEGEIRVFVATEVSLYYYLKENFFTNIFEHDRDHPLYSEVYYTATKKGNPALIQQVNDRLKAVGSQERKQLEDKWIVRDFQDIPQESSAAAAGKDKLALTAAEKSWLEAHPVIRVATEDLPPYTFQENDAAYGYTVDLMQMMAKKVGFQFDIEFLPPDAVMAALKNNAVELTLNQGYSEERATFMLFGKYPFRVKTAIFSKTDRADIHNLETLAGKTCAGARGSAIIQTIREKYPQIRIVTTDSMFDALKMVSVGQADAAIIESNMGQYLLRKYDITDVHLAGFANLFGAQGARASYWAVAKGQSPLKSILGKAYDSLDREERQRLWNKWFQFDFAAEPEPQQRLNLTEQETAWLAEHQTIRFTGDPDWLPQEAFTSEGQYVGIVADILDLLEARLGILIERVPVKTWDEAVRLAEAAEVDMLSETTNSERGTMTFTEPYLLFPMVIVAQQGTALISDPAELKGKRVAVVKGYGYAIPFHRQYPDLDYVEVETVRDGLMRLSTGEVDAFLCAASTASYLMSELGLMHLKFIGSAGLSLDLGFGVRKDTPVLVSILNKALASITEEEKLKIRQKWIPAIDTSAPQTVVPISYSRLIGYGLAVFLILSLVTWVLIKAAKKEQLVVSFGSRWFRGLVLAGLSFFVIIVCLLGWFTLDKNKAQILAGVGKDLTETLITANDRLNFWVEKRISSLKLLGRDPELVTLIKRLLAVKADRESLLASDALQDTRAFFKTNKEIVANIGFFIINTDDISIGSMRDTNIGTPNLIALQRPELLKRAFAGEVLFVPPIESDVPLGKEPPADGARNPSTKFFMGPIREPSGQIIAVMTLRIDPAQEFSQLLAPSITQKTVETYAFSEYGEMLSQSRFVGLLRRIGLIGQDQQSALNVAIRDPGVNLVAGQHPKIERSQQPLTRMASRAIQLKADMAKAGQTRGHSKIEIDMKGYRDYRGVPVFGAWLWNADLGFGLATEIDVTEAMSDYYQIRRTVFGVLGLTLFLSVAAVLLVLILGERTSHALMKARDNLEATVDERTAELQEKQKQLEAAVERSGMLLDSAGEGIFGVDLEGKVAFINPAASRMLGYGSDELIGREVHEQIHHSRADGSVYPKNKCPMYLTHADGTDHHVSDEVLWRKDGTPVPVEYTSMPIKKGDRVVGAVVTFMDITERRDMEAQLESTKSQLQHILDTGPIGVAFSTKGKIHFANPRFIQMFGVGVGDASPDLYVKPEERDTLISQLKAEGKVENYDIQLYNRDHQIRDILITYLPMTYEGEEGILGWLLDITDRKKAEKEIEEKYKELSRFRRMAIGREQKMIELKKEINELLEVTGDSKKYKIH